jgi:hypothetical protein
MEDLFLLFHIYSVHSTKHSPQVLFRAIDYLSSGSKCKTKSIFILFCEAVEFAYTTTKINYSDKACRLLHSSTAAVMLEATKINCHRVCELHGIQILDSVFGDV